MPPETALTAILAIFSRSLDLADRKFYHSLVAPDYRPAQKGRYLRYRRRDSMQAPGSDQES